MSGTWRKTAVGTGLALLDVSNDIVCYLFERQQAMRELSLLPSVVELLKHVDITIDNLPSFVASHKYVRRFSW
ncbi:MAG TPA: hypothetical protein VFS41_12730 [Edaphobacter sp.]|nr:hypothetical protein [Edaphobacter sp.]